MHLMPPAFLFFQSNSPAEWLNHIGSLLAGLGIAGLGLAAYLFVQAYKQRTQQSQGNDSDAQARQLVEQITQAIQQLKEQSMTQHQEQLQALKDLQVAAPAAPVTQTAQVASSQAEASKAPVAAPAAPSGTADSPSTVPASATGDASMQAAIDHLQNREADYPQNLLQAKAEFEQHLSGPNAAQAHIYLAETFFWLGDYASDKSEREKWFSQGVKIGEEAVKHNPNDVAAHLWYAANMGSHGVERGIMASLFYINPIIEHGSKAMDLDEGFFHAAPLRLMGRFYHQCPGWPISKGDINKGMALLEKAVQLAPDFLQNKIYLAEIYMAKRKKREARKLLEEVIAAEPAFLPKLHENIKAEANRLIVKV